MNLEIVVGIPTVGRAAVLRETLAELRHQTRRADRVLVCGTADADVVGAKALGAQVILSRPGLPRQRNAIIDAADTADVIVFFDDDFLPGRDYLLAVERHFTDHPQTVVATGTVLADGIIGPGLSPEQGRRLLERPHDVADAPAFTGYGCNMAVRLAPMCENALRFDERLPLYGWQEDVDLSRCLAAYGDIVTLGAAQGVHLGVKSGRGTGVRLGYSQIANPLYISGKKRGYPLMRAIRHLSGNMAMNLARAAFPEPYVDRRGRLRGNLLALWDLVHGRMDPERVFEF